MSTADPVTPDTITDEQIRGLYETGAIHIDTKDTALFGSRDERHEARARCAEILNARAKTDALPEIGDRL